MVVVRMVAIMVSIKNNVKFMEMAEMVSNTRFVFFFFLVRCIANKNGGIYGGQTIMIIHSAIRWVITYFLKFI